MERKGKEEKTMIPVYSPERIYDAEPDYMRIITWNFANENMEQQAKFKEKGDNLLYRYRMLK